MTSHPPSFVMPVTQPQGVVKKTDQLLRWIVVALLIVSVIVTTIYTALSIYISTQLVYVPQKPIYATPASLGLQFKYVTFPSRIIRKLDSSTSVAHLLVMGLLYWPSTCAEQVNLRLHPSLLVTSSSAMCLGL